MKESLTFSGNHTLTAYGGRVTFPSSWAPLRSSRDSRFRVHVIKLEICSFVTRTSWVLFDGTVSVSRGREDTRSRRLPEAFWGSVPESHRPSPEAGGCGARRGQRGLSSLGVRMFQPACGRSVRPSSLRSRVCPATVSTCARPSRPRRLSLCGLREGSGCSSRTPHGSAAPWSPWLGPAPDCSEAPVGRRLGESGRPRPSGA